MIRLDGRRLLVRVVLLAVVCAALPACAHTKPQVQRYGMVVGLHPEKIEEYERLHAAVWPEVLDQIHKSHIRNYSIYLSQVEPGKYYLFSYFEYVGRDFKADMATMAADPTTQKWWKLTDPCQAPIPTRAPDEWWSKGKEVFHCE